MKRRDRVEHPVGGVLRLKLPAQAYVHAARALPTIDRYAGVHAALGTLPEVEQARCAWLCACSVLHLYERRFVNPAPRTALTQIERWLSDQLPEGTVNAGATTASLKELEAACDAVYDAANIADEAASDSDAAANAAAFASSAVYFATSVHAELAGADVYVDVLDFSANAAAVTANAAYAASCIGGTYEDITNQNPLYAFNYRKPGRIIRAVIREHRAQHWAARVRRRASRLGFQIDREADDITAEFAVALDVLEDGRASRLDPINLSGAGTGGT